MNENIFLTVTIPAYNEEMNIRSTLKEISEYLHKRAFTHEVIVVDDGSSDKTSEYAGAYSAIFDNFKIVKNQSNMGKGYSVKSGMLCAKGKYLLFMDADNSTSIYEFDKFLSYLKEGYDIVIASRRLKDSIVEEAQPVLRAMMGVVYIILSQLILGLKFSDFNCGFKVYSNKTAKLLFGKQKMNDWSFDTEILFIAVKNHIKIKEAPVRWVHKSTSKVRPVKDGIRSFISLVKIKINGLRRLYAK
jgi:dolichyl-phosphate beta-glucosyltransferase